MKHLCILALLVALVATLVSASNSNDSKDVDADLKRIRIDPALRKALLRALRHLKERQEEESDVLNTTEENFATTILDEILEESTSRDDRESNVKYYTTETEGDNGENEIIKTIIITKPKTTLSPPKEDFVRNSIPDPVKEQDNDLVSNQVVRSVASATVNQVEETNTNKVPLEEHKTSPLTTVPNTTPSVVTTVNPSAINTTLPTHNADGENIEKVKSEDVKIYQAPLVAAFTVQQDQRGIPHNVIPLLQSLPKKNPVDFKPSTPMVVSTAVPAAQIQSAPRLPQTPSTAAPISLNTQALEEKTRQLEQQLIALQTQQRLQEQLLRSKIIQEQQLILQQQQQLQQQRLRLEEETRQRLQKFEEEQRLFRQQQQQLQQQQQQLKFQQQQQQPVFKPFPQQQLPFQHQQQQFQQQQFPQPQQQFPQQQQQFFPQQQHQQQQQIPPPPQPQLTLELPRSSPAVQFIPSVSLPGKAIPISVEQQLPFKEPVNFQPNPAAAAPPKTTVVEQVKSISPPIPPPQQQQPQQFPIIPPSPPQLSKQQLLPLKPFQPFNVNQAPAPLNVQPPHPLDQQLPQLQRTRVFRHETGTGNFGFNQLPQQQSNAPFRPSQPIPLFQQNNGFQPLRSDNQLQNLLVQSGITSRSAEDFNIITKVLALNHGIPQSSSQQMFAKLSPEQQQQLLFRKK